MVLIEIHFRGDNPVSTFEIPEGGHLQVLTEVYCRDMGLPVHLIDYVVIPTREEGTLLEATIMAMVANNAIDEIVNRTIEGQRDYQTACNEVAANTSIAFKLIWQVSVLPTSRRIVKKKGVSTAFSKPRAVTIKSGKRRKEREDDNIQVVSNTASSQTFTTDLGPIIGEQPEMPKVNMDSLLTKSFEKSSTGQVESMTEFEVNLHQRIHEKAKKETTKNDGTIWDELVIKGNTADSD